MSAELPERACGRYDLGGESACALPAGALAPGQAVVVDCPGGDEADHCVGGVMGRCYSCGEVYLHCNRKHYTTTCGCGACADAPAPKKDQTR